MVHIIKTYRPSYYREKPNPKPSSDYPWYNSRLWRRISKIHRAEHPLCEDCKDAGELKEGNVTDHVIAISLGGSKDDPRNFRTLCHKCHNIKRGKEAHGHVEPFEYNDRGEKIPKQKI